MAWNSQEASVTRLFLFLGIIVLLIWMVSTGCGSSIDFGDGSTGGSAYGDDDDDNSDDDDEKDDDEELQDTEEPDYTCPESTDPTVMYLSADDSNSQASPVVARGIILQGGLVPRGKIRTYEFTNYYSINYEQDFEAKLNIVPQLRMKTDSEFDREYILQIGAQSQVMDQQSRRPLNVTFSLDTSGSMGGLSIQLLKDVCRAVAGQLREGDIVSMVEWSSSANVLLDSHYVNGPNDPDLLKKINRIWASGSTDLHGGLVRAYEIARKNYHPLCMNRVLLISDGQANTGVTDINLIAQQADDSEQEAIYLVGVGVGDPEDYYNDKLMNEVTDAGKGAYIYVDTAPEAQKQFADRFMENLEIAAMDVRLTLTLPYYMIMAEYHGEEFSDNPEDVDPQHLGANDAMIYHMYLVACDADRVKSSDVIGVQARYLDPVTRTEKIDAAQYALGSILSVNADQLTKGDAIVQYAEALKLIADLIWDDPNVAIAVCQKTRAAVASAAAALNDNDLDQIEYLLELYEETLLNYI